MMPHQFRTIVCSPRVCGMLIAVGLATAPILAQQNIQQTRRVLTAADYARAEKFMGYNTTPLVLRSGVRPTWLLGDRFWYRITTENGAEFMMVDAAKGAKAPAFDRAKIAAALSAATGAKYDPGRLRFEQFDLSADGKSIVVTVARKQWTCQIDGSACVASPGSAPAPARGGGRGGQGAPEAGLDVLSPDGKRAAFVRDFNMWVRDIATRQEKQLTTDGIKEFA